MLEGVYLTPEKAMGDEDEEGALCVEIIHSHSAEGV